MVERYTYNPRIGRLDGPGDYPALLSVNTDMVKASDYDAAIYALRNFYAMVEGESPSLLENDCNAERAREAIDFALGNPAIGAPGDLASLRQFAQYIDERLIAVERQLLNSPSITGTKS